jgi:hypothetical protein
MKTEAFASLRSYLFDYVVGILWLVSAAVITGSLDWLELGLDALNRVKDLPEFVVGFGVVIAGVIVPYCAAILLRPLTLKFMSLLLRAQRSFRKWRRKKELLKKQHGVSLESSHSLANKRMRKQIGLFDTNSRLVRLTYLYALNPSLAAQMERLQDDLWFQAAAALPSTALIGSVTYRSVTWHPVYWSIFVGLIIFSFAVWRINTQFLDWWHSLDAAVLVAPPLPIENLQSAEVSRADPKPAKAAPDLSGRGEGSKGST